MARKKNRFKLRDLQEAWAQMRRLAPYVFPYWPRFLVYLGATLVYSVGNGARAFAIGPFMNMAHEIQKDPTALASGQSFETILREQNVYQIAIILLCAGVAASLGTLVKQYNMNWMMFRARIDVQRDIMLRLMNQPISFFDRMRKGELISRVTNDLSSVQKTFHVTFNDLVTHPIQIVVLIGMMVITSPQLSVAALILPIVMLPVIFFANKIKRLSKKSFQSQAVLTNFFHQFFEGVRVVKAFGMEKQQENELNRTSISFFNQSVKVGLYKGISRSLVEMLLSIVLAGAMIAGVALLTFEFVAAHFDFAILAQFIALMILLYDPVRKLSHTLNNMSEAMGGNERVFELMDTIPTMKDADNALDAPEFAQSVTFENVGFEYDEGRPVLYDVNFSAPKGSMTALVGATGSGKSTLLDLIPRFYKPTQGRVLVDGVDLADVKHATWLSQIAIVSQETFLFNTTIRDNLLAANQDASDDDIRAALEAANIWDEIEATEHGLDTFLGDRGVNLSGGQRQRLAIARAFLKRAPILLLDEATSALDSETERKVQDAIDRLIQGATVFAIAHRLSTISHADRILVLDAGRIVESGTHEELLKAHGRYAMLYQTQRRSARIEAVKADDTDESSKGE